MPKSLIVFFSQLGTTERVAEAIATGLRSSGYMVDLHNLKNGAPPNLKGFDLLGIGSPIYNYTQPFNVMDYLHSLPDLKGLPVFTFNTYATYRFEAGQHLIKLLMSKGAVLNGHFTCHGASSYLGYIKRGYFFSPGYPRPEILAKAEAFGVQITTRSNSKPDTLRKEDQAAPFIYRLERFLTNRWLTQHFYSHFFSADKDRCNGCGVCIKLCPTQNIHKNNNDQPVWQSNCIGCFMCEMKCPQDAISSPIDWLVLRPFLIYNVRKARQDKSLEWLKVKHSHGRTKLL